MDLMIAIGQLITLIAMILDLPRAIASWKELEHLKVMLDKGISIFIARCQLVDLRCHVVGRLEDNMFDISKELAGTHAVMNAPVTAAPNAKVDTWMGALRALRASLQTMSGEQDAICTKGRVYAMLQGEDGQNKFMDEMDRLGVRRREMKNVVLALVVKEKEEWKGLMELLARAKDAFVDKLVAEQLI